jgi:SAM-dependent methyltransferase
MAFKGTIHADADDLEFNRDSMDAILAFYTNDIFRSRQAIAHAVQALRPNGRFVSAGAKLLKLPLEGAYAGSTLGRP